MSEPKIFVAMPLGKNGMLHMETASFCAGLNTHSNIDWGYAQTATAEMSRNVIVENHLRENPDTTHILFIDSDVVPPYGALQRMLGLDEDVVTAPTPIYYNKSLMWNVALPENDKAWFRMSDRLPQEPFYTGRTGFGLVLVKRKVLEDIGWPWFHMEYQEMGESNVAMKTGEDVWFCLRAIEEGYKILADPETQCHHYNQVNLFEIYNSVVKQIDDNLTNEARYATHWDVLSSAVLNTDGCVVEFGAGGSTDRLDMLCRQVKTRLYTYENNREWYEKYEHLQSDDHEIIFVEDYTDIDLPDDCGVLFVDCAPIDSRRKVCDKYADAAEIIVCHDTEEDMYDLKLDSFMHRFDDKRMVPWTSAVSNQKTLDFMENIIPQEKVAVDGIND
jgi:hypothetical protein